MFKKIVTGIVVVFFCAGIASAADQLRTRDRDPLKDGSCQEESLIRLNGNISNLLAADKIKDQKRDQKKLKDGSCQLPKMDSRNISDLLAADQIKSQKKDQKKSKDGSCQI